ncbi:MAG: VanZ family protein [Deltaproteobacteria bacterium]|nr:VanZ family protein [Deltaproteobacteria bacterium]
MKLLKIFEKPWVWAAALLSYLLLIFIVSHLSALQLRIIPFSYWDKAVHCIEYFPVGFLISGMIHSKWTSIKAPAVIVLTIFIVGILAGLDEFHQSFVPGRDASLADVVADLIGGTFGTVVFAAFWKTYFQRMMTTA